MKPNRVLLIHGVLTSSVSMKPLGKNLDRLGYDVTFFNYRSFRKNIYENGKALVQFLLEHKLNRAIIISHSLGSLLIQHVMENYPDDIQPSHVVAIAPPFQGSEITQTLAKTKLSFVVGKSKNPLLPKKNYWKSQTPLGVITGNKSVGVSRLLLNNKKPNDGAVYVNETKINGMKDNIVLPYPHTPILSSQQVAKQCDAFIKYQKFSHFYHS